MPNPFRPACASSALLLLLAQSLFSQTFLQQQELAFTDLNGDERIGFFGALSLNGSTAIVATPSRPYRPNGRGGAAIVVRDTAGAWTQQAWLAAPDGAARDTGSGPVAISADGNTAAIGSTAGIYVYVRPSGGATWTLEATLVNPDYDSDPDSRITYGSALGLSGDGNLLVTGARDARSNGFQQSGIAHVFVRTGSIWALAQKLTAPAQTYSEQFGSSIAVSTDGTTLLISSPQRMVYGGFDGAGYVFTKGQGSGQWTHQGTLTMPGATYLGWATALNADGSTALLGSFSYDFQTPRSAYVFVRSGTSWGVQATLSGSATGQASERFASTVNLSGSGDVAAIGAVGYSGSGAGYIFRRNGASWTRQQILVPLSAQAGDEFRTLAVSGDGSTVLGGAPARPWAQSPSVNLGAAFVFSTSSSGCSYQFSPESTSATAAGGAYSVSVTTGPACTWSVLSSVPWIQPLSTASQTGPGLARFTVLANSSNQVRTTNLNIGGASHSVIQAPPCNYEINGSGVTLPATNLNAFNLFLSIHVNDGCPWTVSSSAPWLTLPSPASSAGNGSFTIGYGVAENTTGVVRSATLTVTGGLTFTVNQLPAQAPSALTYVPITPCRIIDTRLADGPFGGPILGGGSTRTVAVRSSNCGIPPNAAAYVLNLTVVPVGPLSYVTLFPAGQSLPVVSTLNSLDGRIKANAAILPAGSDGSINVFGSQATHFILDINGYFVPSGGLQFYPITPCRIADTRQAAGSQGGPSLSAGGQRSFPVAGVCGVPAGAQAYSLNFTAVPSGGNPLGYLTTWPSGEAQPLASTLNAVTGTVTANAAVLRAGAGGAVSVFASSATDVVIDINGYFAPVGAGGHNFYPIPPCRILDTRISFGAYGGPALLANSSRSSSFSGSPCLNTAYTAAVLSLNATVLPLDNVLSFITLWPSAQSQPVVSTLNAVDGSITSNAAILPVSSNVSAGIYSTHATHLILDVGGYFLP